MGKTDTKPAETKDAKQEPEAKSQGPRTLAKFTGPGSAKVTRIVTAKDFKAAGWEDAKDVTWSAANAHTVDITDWPEVAKELIKAQPDFTVRDTGKTES